MLSQPGGEGHKAIILSNVLLCYFYISIKNRKYGKDVLQWLLIS
jgi:hypothetical protein